MQDGTNSILKEKHSDVPELFETYRTMIQNDFYKIQQENLVLCEVPPLREKEYNNSPNERIKNLMNCYLNSLTHLNLNTNL